MAAIKLPAKKATASSPHPRPSSARPYVNSAWQDEATPEVGTCCPRRVRTSDSAAALRYQTLAQFVRNLLGRNRESLLLK